MSDRRGTPGTSRKGSRHIVEHLDHEAGSIDQKLKQRVERLRDAGSGPTVEEIEERLARLRGVPLQQISNPRSRAFSDQQVNWDGSDVEKLMRKTKDEVNILNRHKYGDQCNAEATLTDVVTEQPSSSNVNILLGQDTIRNLKDLRRTIKLAKKRSEEAAALSNVANDDQSMDEEIKKLIKLTRQSSVKSEKINEELSRFWENRLTEEDSTNDSISESEHSKDSEISDEELKRVIMEAEEAENKVRSTRKERKKGSIFSRFFKF